jgi:uncharacterized protein involved in cysteine biosynthesis
VDGSRLASHFGVILSDFSSEKLVCGDLFKASLVQSLDFASIKDMTSQLGALLESPFLALGTGSKILFDFSLLRTLLFPFFALLFLFFFIFGLALSYQEFFLGLLPTLPRYFEGGFWGSAFEWLLSLSSWILSFLLVFFASSLITLLLAFPFLSYFLERFVEKVLERRNLSVANEVRFFASLRRGLIDEARKTILLLGFAALLFLGGFFPPLFPLVLLGGLFVSGFEIQELPLNLLGIPFPERIRYAFRYWGETLSLGAYFALFSLLPLAGILFLPIGYFMSVEWRAKRTNRYSGKEAAPAQVAS